MHLLNLNLLGYDLLGQNNRIGYDAVWEKLDRALSDEQWLSLYPNSHINCLPIAASDDAPILLNTSKKKQYRKYNFRFQAMVGTSFLLLYCQPIME